MIVDFDGRSRWSVFRAGGIGSLCRTFCASNSFDRACRIELEELSKPGKLDNLYRPLSALEACDKRLKFRVSVIQFRPRGHHSLKGLEDISKRLGSL